MQSALRRNKFNESNMMQKLIITFAVVVVVVRTEECGQEELALCAKPLQVLSATSELSFVTKKEELDKLCPDLHAGLHCIRSYTRRCMNIHQRDHFNKLYHGTNQVIHELCEDGPYQEDFLRHAPCMRHVKKEYEICSSRYQNVMSKIAATAPDPPPSGLNLTRAAAEEEERLRTVCCAFKEYIFCSEHTVRHACGNETALFTRKFLDKMSNSLMRMHCEEYGVETGKCVGIFTSRSTASSIIKRINNKNFIINLLFIYIFLISY